MKLFANRLLLGQLQRSSQRGFQPAIRLQIGIPDDQFLSRRNGIQRNFFLERVVDGGERLVEHAGFEDRGFRVLTGLRDFLFGFGGGRIGWAITLHHLFGFNRDLQQVALFVDCRGLRRFQGDLFGEDHEVIIQLGKVFLLAMLSDEVLQSLESVGERGRANEFLFNAGLAQEHSRPFRAVRQIVIRVRLDELFKLGDAGGELRLLDLLFGIRKLTLNLLAHIQEPEDQRHDRHQSAAARQRQDHRRAHHRLLFEPFVLREHSAERRDRATFFGFGVLKGRQVIRRIEIFVFGGIREFVRGGLFNEFGDREFGRRRRGIEIQVHITRRNFTPLDRN